MRRPAAGAPARRLRFSHLSDPKNLDINRTEKSDGTSTVIIQQPPTNTTLAAGLSSTSTDPVTHNTLSAEQKIVGALSVTTAVTDVGQPYASQSITAGFKLNW